MREVLILVTEYSVLVITAMALVVIVVGTLEAFFGALLLMISRGEDPKRFRTLYLRFARFLVAALTFQLAADILETATSPNWEDIGRLAAIAVIRTFLNYFLERDLFEAQEAAEQDRVGARPSGHED